MEYLETFTAAFAGYARSLWHEVTTPHLGNYFYWLIGLSAVVYALELLFPWRRDQLRIRRDFWLDGFYMFLNFFLFGTACIPGDGRDVKLGFPGLERYPKTFVRQTLYNFVRAAG